MPKYHLTGTVAGKPVDEIVEATVGTEALAAVVKKYIPKAVKEGKASRLYWWNENVSVEVSIVEPVASVNEPEE